MFKKRNTEIPPFFLWGFHILDNWLALKHQGKSLGVYFEDNSINCIAIYGLGALGRRLYEELEAADVHVEYGIDRNAANIHIEGLAVFTLEDKLPQVDAVIVTPIDFYGIEAALHQRLGIDMDVISIEDVVDYCR